MLGTEVNLGIPTEIGGGLIKEVESPIYATGIGLILHRMKYYDQLKKSKKSKGRKKPGVKNILQRVKQWFDEL